MSDSDSISLDELAQAFAKVMQPPATASAEGAQPPPPDEPEPELQPDEISEDAGPQDTGPVTPLGILEAMLFVGDRGNSSLTAARAAELMRGVQPDEIAALVQELNRRYAGNECPYYVAEDSGGYRLVLRKQYEPLRERFFGRIRRARLSQAAIDILAVVAYQQPLTGEQISTVRGRPSGHVLSQLVHRGLLRIERQSAREEGRGKPGTRSRVAAKYHTTDRFLRLFGLQTLADLPQSEELDRQ
jgi:segregation and condensation protein B